MNACIIFLVFFICLANCRDFYVGMFKKNDFLVAQDRLYKEMIPFSVTYAQYGRLFKCPITYFRVVDRLGVGRGPRVQIIRGGLQKKYIVLRLSSSYNTPISVNIYVGCENKMTRAPITEPGSITTGGGLSETTVASSDNGAENDKSNVTPGGNDANGTNADTAATEAATGAF